MPSVVELKSQLKELKKKHKEIRIAGLKKAELEALVNKYSKGSALPTKAKPTKSLKQILDEKKDTKGTKIVKDVMKRNLLKKVILKGLAKRRESKRAVEYTPAEKVFFNPDLLRLIGGYKADLELGDVIKNMIQREDGGFWEEGSDDLNSAHWTTFTDRLIESLREKKNPAKSEYVGSASFYGGDGSHNAHIYNLLNELVSEPGVFDVKDDNHDIHIYTEDAEITSEEMDDYFSDYINVMRDNLEYREEDIDELEERKEAGEEMTYEEDKAITAWTDPLSTFDYGPEVFRVEISYKTEAERLRLIEVLKVFKTQLHGLMEPGDFENYSLQEMNKYHPRGIHFYR